MSPSAPDPACSAIEPPDQRKLRIGDPVLQIGAAEVPNLAELAVARSAPSPASPPARGGSCDRSCATRPRAHGREHALGFLDRVRQRLLAEHDLPGSRRSDGNLRVRVARGADVDDVDVRAAGRPLPNPSTPLPSRAVGPQPRLSIACGRREPSTAAAVCGEKKRRDLPVRVAVRPAHERIANQSDVDVGHEVQFFERCYSCFKFSAGSNERTSFASSRISSGVNFSLFGSITVFGTPSEIVLAI